ncbi:oligoendopeptidase F [Tissierella praeacuta DSM 18095]|uniref:Oligopeptidase F n=1 Tax=Tissierella praeacuta DSM 18095 TaxID=1123404 RepID=A0A1M4S5G0_9FIRM|nr:oligoendopeptidase F [Tissierella praeacuta]SHE27438.1 oligoendopeptidase F [Tissierella praeacuta DSM 18095]SUP00889.1 Oligoendopeptidase F, plasmid [Tissierella praeacuta]
MESNKEILERKDIKKEHQWDLESMFINFNEWEKSYNKAKEMARDFILYKGGVVSSAENFYNVLRDKDDLYRITEHLYSYAHMKLDEDTREGKSQELSDKGLGLYVEVEEKTSFLVPEILTLEPNTLDRYFQEKPELKVYKQYIEDIMRQKEHILSSREESILAQMGEVGNSPQKIFSMLNNADLKFPTIKDEDGKDVEITHGNFIPLMESKNRDVRKKAFEALYNTYKGFKNTFAASLNGDLKNNIFNSNVRKYKSSREASLNQNNISLSVYDNLINSIHNNLGSMYKYMEIRKRALGVEELHMYDLYTPIVKDVDLKIPYEEGVEIVKRALTSLGEEYMAVVEEGFSSRWIDIYENRGKRSGAYSGGSYDSKPFILLNYHDTLDNVFTVAHELGHSIHSYFTRKTQPFVYGNYSIFVAEVASTANEALLMDYMLKNVKDKNERLYLLNHYLESFRTTVFRQTMFAEFEKIINEYLESGGAITADYLCETYKDINKLYYGPNMVVDDEIGMEWARIPHFYYNYYVFQYATGYSAAVALSEKILQEGKPAVDRYINFLKSGSSDYPLNVLKTAGVDMTTEEPVNNAMKLFSKLVDEMDKLI